MQYRAEQTPPTLASRAKQAMGMSRGNIDMDTEETGGRTQVRTVIRIMCETRFEYILELRGGEPVPECASVLVVEFEWTGH